MHDRGEQNERDDRDAEGRTDPGGEGGAERVRRRDRAPPSPAPTAAPSMSIRSTDESCADSSPAPDKRIAANWIVGKAIPMPQPTSDHPTYASASGTRDHRTVATVSSPTITSVVPTRARLGGAADWARPDCHVLPAAHVSVAIVIAMLASPSDTPRTPVSMSGRKASIARKPNDRK